MCREMRGIRICSRVGNHTSRCGVHPFEGVQSICEYSRLASLWNKTVVVRVINVSKLGCYSCA